MLTPFELADAMRADQPVRPLVEYTEQRPDGARITFRAATPAGLEDLIVRLRRLGVLPVPDLTEAADVLA